MNTSLTKEQTENFKSKLLEQKKDLEEKLKDIGHKNPQNPEDWEAVETDIDSSVNADKNEVADKIENYEGNTALLKQFEIELTKVTDALKRIEDGTYGICIVSGEPIEIDRLEANPSAETNKANMNSSI